MSTPPRYPKAKWMGQTANSDGPFRSGEPSFIVMHYTAGGSGVSSTDYLWKPHKPASSAHFVVDRDGRTWQLSDINRKTWHAGISAWRGRTGLNAHSIGIEIANYGYWRHNKKTGDVIPGLPTVELAMQRGWIPAKPKSGRGGILYWEPYPEVQIQSTLELTGWLLRNLMIDEIVGHDDIAPARKLDPGPAFPMKRFQDLLAEEMRPRRIVGL